MLLIFLLGFWKFKDSPQNKQKKNPEIRPKIHVLEAIIKVRSVLVAEHKINPKP